MSLVQLRTRDLDVTRPTISVSTHNDTVPFDLMHGRSFFYYVALALEPGVLLSETTFEDSIRCQDLERRSICATRSDEETLTTSNFLSSLVSVSRDAPCHTRTVRPSECASISFFHCMTATVGLIPPLSTAARCDKKNIYVRDN